MKQIGSKILCHLGYSGSPQEALPAAAPLRGRVNRHAHLLKGRLVLALGDQVNLVSGSSQAGTGAMKNPAVISRMSGTNVAYSHVAWNQA